MTARTIPMGVKGTSLHICTRTKGLTCILLSNVGKKIEARRGATSAITWLRRKKAGIPSQETWMESFSHYARLELNMQNRVVAKTCHGFKSWSISYLCDIKSPSRPQFPHP